MTEPTWDDRPLDPQFLVDSGLLFEVNRQLLHPIGVAMTVNKGEDGRATLSLLDHRAAPEKAIFPPSALEACARKLSRFVQAYGRRQMAARRRALGQAVQHVEPSWQ